MRGQFSFLPIPIYTRLEIQACNPEETTILGHQGLKLVPERFGTGMIWLQGRDLVEVRTCRVARHMNRFDEVTGSDRASQDLSSF